MLAALAARWALPGNWLSPLGEASVEAPLRRTRASALPVLRAVPQLRKHAWFAWELPPEQAPRRRVRAAPLPELLLPLAP